MAHFYGSVQGALGEATRMGNDGIDTVAASWQGSIRVYVRKEGAVDMVRVEMHPVIGAGERRTLYDGPIGEFKPQGGDDDNRS